MVCFDKYKEIKTSKREHKHRLGFNKTLSIFSNDMVKRVIEMLIIQFLRLMTCRKLVVFTGYSGFLHQLESIMNNKKNTCNVEHTRHGTKITNKKKRTTQKVRR